MMSRLTKRQLVAFVIVTALSVGIMAAWYVRIPQLVGIGRYEVVVTLPETGGLYPKSLVTYRGRDVGVVKDLSLQAGGSIDVVLSIDNGVEIPRDAQIQVRSASAIGEQYLNFSPDGPGGSVIEDGDHIEAGETAIPTSTGELLASMNGFFASVPREDLQTVLTELDTAFAGTGDDLTALIDAGTAFQDGADANLEPTLGLIGSLDPVLAQQVDLDPDVRQWAKDLDTFTAQLASSDQEIRSLLETGGPLAEEVVALVKDLDKPLPRLLTDLSLAGEVLEVYIPAVEHTLAVLPGAIEMHMSSFPRDRWDDAYPEANLSFKLSVNNPATCRTGFENAGKQRSPKDLSPAPIPQDSWCKVPHDDPRVVRGARNQACPNGGYAATAAGCGLIFQRSKSDVAFYDSSTGRLMAPDGTYYRVPTEAQAVPGSWQDYLVGLAGAGK